MRVMMVLDVKREAVHRNYIENILKTILQLLFSK